LINELPEKYVKFYFEYATMVAETLKWSSFQNFLNWITKEENINKNRITDIQVKVFPYKKKRGKGLAGRCSRKGQIKIYPRGMKFLRKLLLKTRGEELVSYIKARAMSTLIHEVLHIKYQDDEEKVKALTRSYLNIFDSRWQRINQRSQKHVERLNTTLHITKETRNV